MIKSYRKRPVTIQAVQYDGENVDEVKSLCPDGVSTVDGSDEIVIHTLEGDMRANVGDYIIKGVKGEPYPCRQDIFEETYYEVEVYGEVG